MSYTVISVGKGETAKSVAQKYKATEKSLFLLNGDIGFFEGERLIVETCALAAYVVMPFDTVKSVAEKFGVSADALKKQNSISDRIFLGQTLYIPNDK